MRTLTVVEAIASTVQAYHNCVASGNTVWEPRHKERVEKLVYDFLPSGSGIDSGTQIDLEKSTGNKLVFYTSFHHMDEYGEYDGWTSHTVTVRPDFVSRLYITVSGRNRNDIKEYLNEVFYHALTTEFTE